MRPPITPSKDRTQPDPVRIKIGELNERYNLGVVIREEDVRLSPRAGKYQSEQKQRNDAIVNDLRYIHYQGQAELPRIIDDFDKEARDICSRWIHKPRARGLLPTSPDPPKATSAAEQHEFKEALARALKSAKAKVLKDPNRTFPDVTRSLFTTTQAAPAPESDTTGRSQTTARRRSSKRRSEVDQRFEDVSIKRVRTPETVLMPPPLPPKNSFGRSTVASTSYSKASESSIVFSELGEGDPPPLNTQTTIEASSQEKSRLAEPLHRSGSGSQDSYPASSGLEQVLLDSFSRAEHESSPYCRRVGSSSISTVYSSIPGLADLSLPDIEPPMYDQPVSKLAERLRDIWPAFPPWLEPAPFTISWEVTRIALHCGVDLREVQMAYNPEWESDQDGLRRALYASPLFAGKSFPERPSTEAWKYVFGMPSARSADQTVVFSGSLDYNKSRQGEAEPIYKLKLQPLRLDRPTRLSRRFGADRFLEILLPSPSAFNDSVPQIIRNDTETAIVEISNWLTRNVHQLAGRNWAAFYTKDAGYRKPLQDVRLGPEPTVGPISKERVYLFAEDGCGFSPQTSRDSLSSASETDPYAVLSVRWMLVWLLQFGNTKNKKQPYLKLFSRIALGLSRITPTVTFQPHQIRHQESDLLSPVAKVMNDGIGRMSLTVARKVRDVLGQTNLPCAIQGRIGSAKGMWLLDVNDPGCEDWIETYPSQRKWECDFSDEYQRTLEVRGFATQLKAANLNLQLLPVLEDRAQDKENMRSAVGKILTNNLERDLLSQKAALEHPLQFLQWVNENIGSARHERVFHNAVPFLGGLPQSEEEALNFLAAAGFDAKKQKFMQDIAYKLQYQKCKKLEQKLNVRVGRSAYIYMVIDFQGILKPDEVHLGFSSMFRDEDSGFADTLVHGVDVLVARSPAHYVSDIQRVKAVFKPELHALKDVIIFPSTGNIPLAEKLSGGDYDGDLAWVCWDDRIVTNFVNAEVPDTPNLFERGYLRQDKTTFAELKNNPKLSKKAAVTEFIARSFAFNMRDNFLGRCTVYKERLCYKNGNVNDADSILLSTLVSHLVDQAKQGIDFTTKDWYRLLKEQIGQPPMLPDPAYKALRWDRTEMPSHIIDYLKFEVAKPAIDRELRAFNEALNPQAKARPSPHSTSFSAITEGKAHYWDEELAKPYKYVVEKCEGSRSFKQLIDHLVHDLSEVKSVWEATMGKDRNQDQDEQFPDKVRPIYEQWVAIQPRYDENSRLADSKRVALITQDYLHPDNAEWARLKASATFYIYYKRSPNFVWRMAGRQLQLIKAMSAGSGLVAMNASTFAASRPDPRHISQVVAIREGQHTSSQYAFEFEEWSGFIEEDA